MDKVVSEWVNANLEKYPLISQIKTNNNNQDNNTTSERCCSLQETDAETWYFRGFFEDFLTIFTYFWSNKCPYWSRSRFFSKVSPSRYVGQTEGLTWNSKPMYEVCDSKSEKSAPMFWFERPLFVIDCSSGSRDWLTWLKKTLFSYK